MQKVGHHLQVEAVKKAEDERDMFARSAYNRYYYAVFLAAREMVSELDPKWAKSSHKSYPELLNGQITKKFKSEKRRAIKSGDRELIPLLDGGIRAAATLASIMLRANGVRVVADYEPSESVNFTSAKRFSLKSIDISEAHQWDDSVRVLTSSICEAWKHINV